MDLSQAPIRIASEKIVDRLRLAFPERDFTIERVPPNMTLKEFERVVRKVPFLGLAFVGLSPDGESGRRVQAKQRWRLILVYKSSGAQAVRFTGDKRGIGLDAMVDVASVMMHSHAIEGLGDTTLTSAESMIADGWTDEHLVLAKVDFEVRYIAQPSTFQLKTAEDFKALGVTWLSDLDEPVEDTITLNEEEVNG